MSFFVVNKLPIFISRDKDNLLCDEFLKTDSKYKDSCLNISVRAFGSDELDKYIYEKINKEYLDNCEKFKSNWFEFDIKNKDASDNVWNLLYDYCFYFGYARVSNISDYPIAIDSYLNTAIFKEVVNDVKLCCKAYPRSVRNSVGKIFTLSYFIKSEKWWKIFDSKNKGRIVRVIINTEKVKRLKGNLKDFVVETDDFKLICNENFEIYPK